jgi:hypothetical protein
MLNCQARGNIFCWCGLCCFPLYKSGSPIIVWERIYPRRLDYRHCIVIVCTGLFPDESGPTGLCRSNQLRPLR